MYLFDMLLLGHGPKEFRVGRGKKIITSIHETIVRG